MLASQESQILPSNSALAQNTASLETEKIFAPLIHYPQADTFQAQGKQWVTEYATDSLLQAKAEWYLRRYRPERATVLLADLHDGRILAVAERDNDTVRNHPVMTFTGNYPAASLIKIVTAAAALEGTLTHAEDSVPQLGGFHTLYRSQLRIPERGRIPKITLREAFARSVNPAFGLLGQRVGAGTLQSTAEKMGFNRALMQQCAPSLFQAPDSGFALAEAACGFTPKSTLTPFHALMLARAIGDDGRLLPPSFALSRVELGTGKKEFAVQASTEPLWPTAKLARLQTLMEATTTIGTARRGFHRAFRAEQINKLVLGGKTGSLDGQDPPGRYEWYIGYARLKSDPTQGLAIAVMMINEHYLAVHASEFAGQMMKEWLRSKTPPKIKKAASSV